MSIIVNFMEIGLCRPLNSSQNSTQIVDAAILCRYINDTSLLPVSTAGRGAASSEVALAFYRGLAEREPAF